MHFSVPKLFKCRPFLVGLVAFEHQYKNVKSRQQKTKDFNKEETPPVTYNTAHRETELPPVRNPKKQRMENNIPKCETSARIVENFRAENKISGLSVAVSVNGRLVFKRGFGYEDLENKIEASADMRANIASVTKLFTTHLFMKAQTRVDLTEDIREYIPDIIEGVEFRVPRRRCMSPGQTAPFPTLGCELLPIWWLLTHMSSLDQYLIKDAYDTTKYECLNDNPYIWEYFPDEVFCGDNWPGTNYLYTSVGFEFLGAILEMVTVEKDFYQLLTNELEMMNLNDTYLHKSEDINFKFGKGYTQRLECDPMNHTQLLWNCPYSDYSGKYASEGLVSTVGDMIKFGDMYLRMNQDLVNAQPLAYDVVDSMWGNYWRHSEKWKKRTYHLVAGLGWEVQSKRLAGEPLISKCDGTFLKTARHDGSAVGYSSVLSVSMLENKDTVNTRIAPAPRPLLSRIRKCKREERRKLDFHFPHGPQSIELVERFNRQNCAKSHEVKGITVAVIGNCAVHSVTELAELLTLHYLEDLYCQPR